MKIGLPDRPAAVGNYVPCASVGKLMFVLTTIRHELGALDKVKRIVRVTGYVNSVGSFGDRPKVVNGASDLFEEIFGEDGKHARTAVGVNSLYQNISVEIDTVVQLV